MRLDFSRLLAAAVACSFALLAFPVRSGGAREPDGSAPPASPAPAVVQVQVELDPFSLGPPLLQELSLAGTSDPYAAELRRRLTTLSTGFGFFVTPRGQLVTNAHIILVGVRYPELRFTDARWDSMRLTLLAAKKPWVTVRSGDEVRRFQARVLALDEQRDLALLQVERPPRERGDLPTLALADSDKLTEGDAVIAPVPAGDMRGKVLSLIYGTRVQEELRIVTPGGAAATTPRLSGLSGGEIMRFQHDLPLERGSSGLPLLNNKGQVSGIAYAQLHEAPTNGAGAAPGLKVAIASNAVRDFLDANGVSLAKDEGGAAKDVPLDPRITDPKPQTTESRAEGLPRPLSLGETKTHLDLMVTNDREGRFVPAFHEAAWLFFLADAGEETQAGARYLREPRVRGIVSRLGSLPEPLRFTLVALEARDRLLGSATRGLLAPQKEAIRGQLTKLASQASLPAQTRDPVGLAARADCLLSADLAAEAIASPDLAQRKSFLRRALALAELLTKQMPQASRPWALAGTAKARLASISGDWQTTQEAADALERALSLHESPVLRFALEDLRAKLAPKPGLEQEPEGKHSLR